MTDKPEKDDSEAASIALIQKSLGRIKSAAKREIKRAKDSGDARLINDWGHVYHDAGKMHANWTDILLRAHPDTGPDIVAFGPGGR